MPIKLNQDGIQINDEPKVLLCASFFYFRIPREEWASRAKLLVALGYNCVDIYFPWNFHETEPGTFHFDGKHDVQAFLELCKEHHLYVIARPGPYICSEWDGGGLPAWVLHEQCIRQNDAAYLHEVEKWFDQIVPLIATYQLGGNRDGTVIMMQLENELDFFDCHDPEGYMGKLRDMAVARGIRIPLFACAGQGDIRLSGGLTDGVVPTYNFYPPLEDAWFDARLSRYARHVRRMGLPFLVTETNREHCTLKRELLAGAKLLGAYNQVGGSNFSYYQSVNNWGNPLALIGTLYDFGGMIDNLGHCTAQADEALLLSELIRVYGASLAGAANTAMTAPLSFAHADVSLANIIVLGNQKGQLLCVRSVASQTITAYAQYETAQFRLQLAPFEVLALPYRQQANGYEIVFSSAEVFSLQPLVLIARDEPLLILEKNGRRLTINESGRYEGISVAFITKQAAVERIKAARGIAITYAKDRKPEPVRQCLSGEYVNPIPFMQTSKGLFYDHQIWFGEVEYRMENTGNRDLFLQGVSDFLTVKNDDRVVLATLCTGNDVVVPGKGEVRAFVEQWGHSNFDDAREASLRIRSDRGIKGIFEIRSQPELTGWQFTECEHFVDKMTFHKRETDPYLTPNYWNSTHEPLIAAYYTAVNFQAKAGEHSILWLEGMQAETKLWINDTFVFSFAKSAASIDITEYITPGTETRITLCVRKANWAQSTGTLHALNVLPATFSIRRVDHLTAHEAVLHADQFPLRLVQGRQYVACVDQTWPDARYGLLQGEGFRATVMQHHHVIARIVAPQSDMIQVGSPDSARFLIPRSQPGKLFVFIEAMQNGSFAFLTIPSHDGNP